MVPVAFWIGHFLIFVITGKMQQMSTQANKTEDNIKW